jgi:ubiquinone/menaquinone biosynthesis C-methylase UbiE
MSVAEESQTSEFVDFWNEILVPKFTKYRHVLVGGLTHHSAKVLPSLEVKPGDRALDVGCGFGDTAMELARRVAPGGSVLGIDCCNAFLEEGRKDAAATGVENLTFLEGDAQTHPFEPVYDFCFLRAGLRLLLLALRHPVLREPGGGPQEHARVAQARRHHDHDRLAQHRRQSLARHAQGDRAGVPAAAR